MRIGPTQKPHPDKMKPFEWLYWAFVEEGLMDEAQGMHFCLMSLRFWIDDSEYKSEQIKLLRKEIERLGANPYNICLTPPHLGDS